MSKWNLNRMIQREQHLQSPYNKAEEIEKLVDSKYEINTWSKTSRQSIQADTYQNKKR